jgi:hypothetical protein
VIKFGRECGQRRKTLNNYRKQKPPDHDILASVVSTLEEYKITALDETMARNMENLKQLMTNLEGRGCQILFCECRMAGARNVFLRLGQGREHLYDQSPAARKRRVPYRSQIARKCRQ